MEEKMPGVGVGVVVTRRGKLLLGQRAGAHGAGLWALPGGKIKYREHPEDAGVRELWEETGMVVPSTRRIPVYSSDMHDEVPGVEGPHFVTVFVTVEVAHDQRPRRTEPDKCLGWEWFSWDDLPAPLFLLDQHVPDLRRLCAR